MNNLVLENLSMSSKEIAELTGKQHSHVMRDIRSMVERFLADPDLDWHCESTTYKDAQGKQREMFHLDRNTTMALVTGYDPVPRMRIIQRWQELEEKLRRTPEQVLMAYWRNRRRGASDHYNALMREIDRVIDETEGHRLDPDTLRCRKNSVRSNEANMLNRMIIGMDSGDFRSWFKIFKDPIRDSMPGLMLDAYEKVEIMDTALVRRKMRKHDRDQALRAMLDVTFPEVVAYRELVTAEVERILEEERESLEAPEHPEHPARYRELQAERELLEIFDVQDAVLLSLTAETPEQQEALLERQLDALDRRAW